MSRMTAMALKLVGGLLGPAAQSRLGKRLEPPRFDGFIRIYPTLVCNLKCEYCVNLHNPESFQGHDYQPLAPEEWTRALNRIGRNVIVSGGEPFLYPGIVELLNGIRPELEVRVYTNFTAGKTLELLRRVDRPIRFLASYHPASGPAAKFLDVIDELRSQKKFQGTIHGIGTEDQAPLLEEARREFAARGFKLKIDQDQRELFEGSLRLFRRSMWCSRRVILVGPDGRRFQCVAKLTARKDPLGSILEADPAPELVRLECPDFGFCAPCDYLGETTFEPVHGGGGG